MANFRIPFEKLDKVTPDEIRKGTFGPGYEHVNVHMIFDVNIYGNFTRKVILASSVHTTEPPPPII